MLCLLVSVNLYSQIEIDKVEENGSRFIITKNKNIYTEWTSAAAMSLSYILTVGGDESYQIGLCLNEE